MHGGDIGAELEKQVTQGNGTCMDIVIVLTGIVVGVESLTAQRKASTEPVFVRRFVSRRIIELTKNIKRALLKKMIIKKSWLWPQR